MDISSDRWTTEWDFDDYDITNEYNMETLDEFTTEDIANIEQSFSQSLSPENNSPYTTFDNNSSTSTINGNSNGIEGSQSSSERPSKQLKSNSSWKSMLVDNTQPNATFYASSQVICFDKKSSPPSPDNLPIFQFKEKEKERKDLNGSQNNAPKANRGAKRTQTMTNSLQGQDHILAERKRRERLTQRFIALSAVVPGLKKMDKATILVDATRYIKQLQEHVKLLEQQANKKPIETVVFVKKSQLSTDDDSSSCDESFNGNSDQALPEVQAKVSDKNVLLRIHSEMQKGFLVNVIGEIEKLHLTVTSNSVLQFGSSLDISIIAQMDAEFCMTGKDLVKILRLALAKFM